MLILGKLLKLLERLISTMHWYVIVLIYAFYAGSTWLLLSWSGEEKLTSLPNFIYWLTVTASTVGYGDLSPTSNAGKLLIACYVIPFGIALFALVLGRSASWFSQQWFKGVRGLKQIELSDHLLLIGWNGRRTLSLLNLLITENKDLAVPLEIVLCVTEDMENPLPGKIHFVRSASFNHGIDMACANVATAKVIIIDYPQDDMSMTTTLFCNQQNPTAHIIAYFNDESLAELLKSHCPNVEVTPSVAIEMLAKSAFDPGSSALHQELLNVAYGQAQYSLRYPSERPTIVVNDLFLLLKQHYKATLIAVRDGRQGSKLCVNPDLETAIQPGSIIYYIADQRIHNIDWERLHV
jgi:voltage-gated potassium channel